MIEKFNLRNSKTHPELLNFIVNIEDSDFYLTEHNDRIYIKELVHLKKFFKNSMSAFYLKEGGDYIAFVLIWESIGGDKKRNYVKLLAKDIESATNLMRGFLWNVKVELYAKLNKKHPFLSVFKRHGFKFVGGRGKQILLYKNKPIQREKESRIKENSYNERIEE